MTPPNAMPPNGSDAAPSKLPLIALIMSVLGLCICLPAPVGLVLGIISLTRKPQGGALVMAVLAVVLSVLSVFTVGITAAIAIPNFMKFQARSRQSECKVQLRAIMTAEKMALAEHDEWAASFGDLQLPALPNSRYSYFLSNDEMLPASAPGTGSPALHQQALDAHELTLGVQGKKLTIGCVGNVDNDSTLDIWTLDSEGTMNHPVDDVVE